MENEKSLKDEIITAIREMFGLFQGEIRNELGSFKAEINSEFHDEFASFRDEVNCRFDGVDGDLGRLEVMIDEIDGKFSLITEGQDLIQEVLETRVVNIEEILGIESRA